MPLHCSRISCLSPDLPNCSRTIEITLGIVCACLPAINLMLEKHNAARVSQNRPRTRFVSSIMAWKNSLGSSILKSIHVTQVRHEDVNTTGASRSPWYVDEEIGLQDIRAGGRRSTTSKSYNVEVDQLLIGRCTRLSSKDGREEGWLSPRNSEPGGSGADVASGTSDPTVSPRGVTLQQLRQDPREILVPDRIWDGKRRSHEGSGPSAIPASSSPRLLSRSISSLFSSEGPPNSFGDVASSSAAGPP